MKHLCFVVLLILISTSALYSQTIHWQKSLGGSQDDFFWESMKLKSGYILCGTTNSNNGDVTGLNGQVDTWLVKTDNGGNILWAKCYGGSSTDVAYSVDTTLDGGVILGGYTLSKDIVYVPDSNKGMDDYWVTKTDSMGNVLWSKTYGGSSIDRAWNIRHTGDGGYILCGFSLSADFDKTVSYGSADWWIVKLDDTGSIEWQKTLGGSGYEWPLAIRQTNDAGFILSGYTMSANVDIQTNKGQEDCWIVKLNSTGALQWQKTFGGTGIEEMWDIVQTTDGGYIGAGFTNSTNGDVTNNHGQQDAWVIKMDGQGNLQWQKTYGGAQEEAAYAIVQTLDSGFMIVGSAESNDGDVSFIHSMGVNDAWAIKTDKSGTIEWEKCYGGSSDDFAYGVNQITDSIFVLAITSSSTDGDITNPKGARDFWFVKIGGVVNAIGSITEHNEIKVFPTITKGTVNIELPPYLENATINVVNEQGQRIGFTGDGSGCYRTIDLKTANTGLYLLHIRYGGNRKTYKVFVY